MIEERGAKRPLDFRSLKGAMEGKDPDALLAFYAEDAELRIENAALPEGRGVFELRGRAQIERYLRAICEQEMECLLLEGGAVYGERSVAFVGSCRYPDGGALRVETMLEVEGGLIARQIDSVRRAASEDAMSGGEH